LILQTLVFWAFFRTIFHGLNILSTFALSSLYGLILGLKSKATHKAPFADFVFSCSGCSGAKTFLKKLEKTFEKRLTIVNGYGIMVSREREKHLSNG
jgi:hypothetical protein